MENHHVDLPANLVYYPPNEAHLEGLTITPHKTSFWSQAKTFLRRKYAPGPWRHALAQVFPIIKNIHTFRTNYGWDAFLADMLAGATVCTLMIPQSLSYATLAGLPPQFGLYTACFASLVYFIFGTCRETSLGPFALVSLMVAQIVNEMYPTLITTELDDPILGLQLRLMYTMTLTLVSGILLLILALLKLGWIIDLFSNPSLQAFLAGAAYSVGATQLGALFGVPTAQGSFAITLVSFFANITKINWMTTIVGVTVCALVCCSDIYSQKKKFAIPIPSQIILVILSTFASWLFSFHAKFNVNVIGQIESGFPTPTLPNFTLVFTDSRYWVNAIPVAASSFVVLASISAQMADKFRHEYQVNYNSETLSLAVASFLGSFVNVYPSSAAYSRTSVCLACKPRTNAWNLTTGLIIALVIFIAGPFVYHLPKCALAAVVIASFRQTYLNWQQGVNIWKQNAGEGVVYYFTFFATIIISIQAGVFAAFIGSIMHIILQQSAFIPTFMAQIPHTQRFVTTERLPSESSGFYEFLTNIENDGGIYKVQARDYASEMRLKRQQQKQHASTSSTSSHTISNRNERSSSFDGDYQLYEMDIVDNNGQQLPSTPNSTNNNNNNNNNGNHPSNPFDADINGNTHNYGNIPKSLSTLSHLPTNTNNNNNNNNSTNSPTDSDTNDDDLTAMHNEFAAHTGNTLDQIQQKQQDGVGDHDIRILSLHIGAPLSFLNAAPLRDYIVRYIEMYKYYQNQYPQFQKQLISNSDFELLPLAPQNLKIKIAAAKSLYTQQQAMNDQYSSSTTTTSTRTNDGSNSPQYTTDPTMTPQNKMLQPQPLPEPFDLYSTPFSSSTSSSTTISQHIPTTSNLSTFNHNGLNQLPQQQTAPVHPINQLTKQHKNFLNLFNPSKLLSAQQQLLISTLLQETFEQVPETTLNKFKLVIILDFVSKIDITALNSIMSLQQSFPQLLILFTHPGEELIEQLTINQFHCKTTSLHFATKLIFDSIYIAQEYSRYLLNAAEQGSLYSQREIEKKQQLEQIGENNDDDDESPMSPSLPFHRHAASTK